MHLVLLVALLVAVGKAAGFLRETVIARAFGLSSGYTAYVYAAAVPFAISTMLAYALNWLLLPEYQRLKRIEGTEHANATLYRRVLLPFVASLAVTAAMSPEPAQQYLASLMPAAYDGLLVTRLVVILSVSIPLQIIASTLTTQALAAERNVLVASQPILQSIVMLFGLVLLKVHDPLPLAFLYLASQVGFIVVALATLRLEALRFETSRGGGYGFPLGVGLTILAIESLPQVSSAIDRIVIGRVLERNNYLAQFAYAQNLTGFGVAIGVALVLQLWFPYLLKHDRGERDRLSALLHAHTIPISLMMLVYFWVASYDLVYVAFVGGKFSSQNAHMVNETFRMISPTIVFDLNYSIAMSGAIAAQRHGMVLTSNVILFLVRLAVVGALLVVASPAVLAGGLVAASVIRLVVLSGLVRRADRQHRWSDAVRRRFTFNLSAGALAAAAMALAILAIPGNGLLPSLARGGQFPVWLAAYWFMSRMATRCPSS